MLNHLNLKNLMKQEFWKQFFAKVGMAGALFFLGSCGAKLPDIKSTAIASIEITDNALTPLELEEADPNNSGFLSPLEQEAKNLSGTNIVMAYDSMGAGDTWIYKQQKDIIVKNKLLLLKNNEWFNQNKYQLVLVPPNFDKYKTYTTNAEVLKIIESLNDSDTSNDTQAQDLLTNNGITKIVVINSKVDKQVYGIDQDNGTIFENIEGKTLQSLGDQIVKLNTNLATFFTNKGQYNTNSPQDTQLPVAEMYFAYTNNDLSKPAPETKAYLKNKYILPALTVDQVMNVINNNFISLLAEYYKYIDKTVTIPTTLDQFINLVSDLEREYIDLKLQQQTIKEDKNLDKETRDLTLKQIENKLKKVQEMMSQSKVVFSNIFGSAINTDNLPNIVYSSSLGENENTLKTNVTNKIEELKVPEMKEKTELLNNLAQKGEDLIFGWGGIAYDQNILKALYNLSSNKNDKSVVTETVVTKIKVNDNTEKYFLQPTLIITGNILQIIQNTDLSAEAGLSSEQKELMLDLKGKVVDWQRKIDDATKGNDSITSEEVLKAMKEQNEKEGSKYEDYQQKIADARAGAIVYEQRQSMDESVSAPQSTPNPDGTETGNNGVKF